MKAARNFAAQMLATAKATSLDNVKTTLQKAKDELLLLDRSFKVDLLLLECSQDAFDRALEEILYASLPDAQHEISIEQCHSRLVAASKDFLGRDCHGAQGVVF